MKRTISILLCLMLVLSLAAPVFAANANPHTITINNSVAGYEYVAYQIFKGDLVDDQLQNIEWGDNISDAAALLTELKKIPAFADCANVVDVAAALGTITTKDHETTKAFADVVATFLTSANAGESSYAGGKYTIDVEGDGYYLVLNTKVPDEGAAFTRYILEVVKNVTVANKGTVPSVEKKILEGETPVDANTADIGDTITYQFTGTMPSNIADYDSYYYVFTDTMSNGLTYTGNLSVKVNDHDVTKYFWSNSVAKMNTQGAELKVGIQDILSLETITGEITADTKVVVTYTALVNEDAQVGVDGETNEVKLQFSNDPNNDGDGSNTPDDNPSEPVPSLPTGETPKDEVKTFTAEIKITKVDSLSKMPLTGAKFSISGVSSKVVVVNKEMFVEDEDGTYYRLKDGTYTLTAPVFVDNPATPENEKNSDAYDLESDNTAKKYKKVETLTSETVTENFEAEGWVKTDGTITFTGLGEGTYTITELVAPEGYNKLEDPITVIITSNAGALEIDDGSESVTWKAKVGTKDADISNGTVEFQVENTSGSQLPSTGGVGTTLFYVFGSIMFIGAAVLLITKKRMAA